jgi:hypothetical protein
LRNFKKTKRSFFINYRLIENLLKKTFLALIVITKMLIRHNTYNLSGSGSGKKETDAQYYVLKLNFVVGEIALN